MIYGKLNRKKFRLSPFFYDYDILDSFLSFLLIYVLYIHITYTYNIQGILSPRVITNY